jgi:hypothetical protein
MTVELFTPILIGSRIPKSTSGSVLFIDSELKLAEDNSNFFWDNVNKILKAKNFEIPTTSATEGQIKQNGNRLIHTFGTCNLFIGENSGNFTTTGGGENVGLGGLTLNSLTTGIRNVAIGEQALQNATTTSNNFAMGSFALNDLTTSVGGNVAIGSLAGQHIISNDNVAIGSTALRNITTTGSAVGIGANAGTGAAGSTGRQFVAIGHSSCTSQTTSLRNTGVGFQTLRLCTSGSNNTAIGFQAGDAITTGSRNIYIGQTIDAALNNENDKLNIGNLLKGNMASGSEELSLEFDNAKLLFGTAKDASIYYDGTNLVIDSAEVGTGYVDFKKSINIPTTSDSVTGIIFQNGSPFIHSYGTSNVFVGCDSGNFTSTGDGKLVAIGTDAFKAATTANKSVAIGFEALLSSTSGVNNVAIGARALRANIDTNSCVAIGTDAGLQTTGAQNMMIGAIAGTNLKDGIQNSFIGTLAGSGNTGNNTADHNVFVGFSSGTSTTSGGQNVGIGTNSLDKSSTGASNVAIGFKCGQVITNQDHCVWIGNVVGRNTDLGSDTLAIDSSDTATPLIFGSFVDRTLTFNGSTTTTGDSTVDGVRNQKYYCEAFSNTTRTVVIITKDEWHPAFGLTQGLCADFIEDEGGLATIDSIAQNGSDITITTAAEHGFDVGDPVSFVGSTGYDGQYMITAVADVTHFDVTAAFDSDGSGFAIVGDNVEVPVDGTYIFTGFFSGAVVTSGATFEFDAIIDDVLVNKGRPSRKFANAGDVGNMSGTFFIDLTAGQKLSFVARNISNTNNFTSEGTNINIHRIV